MQTCMAAVCCMPGAIGTAEEARARPKAWFTAVSSSSILFLQGEAEAFYKLKTICLKAVPCLVTDTFGFTLAT